MGFWNRITKRNNNVADAVLNTPSVANYGNGALLFGNLLNQATAMNISTVYRCVDLISDSVAMLPINVVNESGDKINHPLTQVLSDKNNRLTKYEFIKQLISSVLLKGNGFAYITRNPDGSVKQLRWLESADVTINYNKNGDMLYYQAPLVSNKRIEPINMIHVKKHSWDGVNGVSVVAFANKSVKNTIATDESAFNFFNSGCNLSGVLTVNSALTPQQILDIKQSWNSTYSSGNGGVSVLQGNMSYQPISVNANDAQLLDSRKYNSVDICRWFGIAPILIGDYTNGSAYGTLESAQNDFILHTLLGYVVMIEQEFSKKLLKYSESNLKVNLDENFIMKADKTAQANYYSTLINCGVLSINEVREQLGFKPVDGGDKHIIPFTDVNQNTINNNNNNNQDETGNQE